VKTVRVPFDGSVAIAVGSGSTTFGFDNVNGGLYYGTTDFGEATLADIVVFTYVRGDVSRALRTSVSAAGRPSVCSFGAKLISGFTAC
jgi:hypothetical protein